MPYLEWSTFKLLQNKKHIFTSFHLAFQSFQPPGTYSPVLQNCYRWSKCQDLFVKYQFMNFSASRYNLLNWFFSFLCQSAIYQRLKQKHDCKHEMKLKPCLNSTGLQWAVPSVTRSKWLKLTYHNVWSGRVTKTNKKGEKEKKKKREERSEEQSRGAVTFSSGGWRAPSLLVKEELFHPAITESLSPH